jgi:hypothetical protein
MSEADSTATDPTTTVRDRALMLGVAAIIAWLATIAIVLADISVHDKIPNGIGITLATLAATATLSAIAFGTRYAILRRLDDLVAGQTPTAVLAARLRQLVTASTGEEGLERSQYWRVYNDVLQDLGGIRGDDPPLSAN